MQATFERTDLCKDSYLLLERSFVPAADSATLFDHCLQTVNWEQSEIRLFGKSHRIPRLNAWYGERGYIYSGVHFEAQPWTDPLLELKAQIEAACGISFNSALCNLYRTGQDSMGWHSDDETSLGSEPQIASISLGASRDFVLRSKADPTNKVSLDLTDGSLLVMCGATQSLWQHCLPRRLRVHAPRINITFRSVAD